MKKTSKRRRPQNEDYLKNEKDHKNVDNLKNKDNLKNEDDLKKRRQTQKWRRPKNEGNLNIEHLKGPGQLVQPPK